jgi:purine-cytosine permease-like protein
MGLTRIIFGVRGTVLPTIANTINLFGWTAVANFFAAITLSYLAGDIFGTPVYGEPGSGIVLAIGAALNGIVSLIIVKVAGSKSIKIAERLMMIVLIGFTTWITIVVFRTTTIAELIAWRPDPEFALPFGVGVDAMLALSMAWSTVVGEFTRYTKTKRSATLAPMIGANLAMYWFAMVGCIGVIAVAINTGVFNPNNADPSSIAMSLGLGWVALIVVVLSTITTNMVDLYVASFNVMNLFPKMNFDKASMITGVSCIMISWVPIIVGNFIAAFFGFINILGAVFPPLLAILLVDYYIIRKGDYRIEHIAEKGGMYWYKGGFNVVGISSWAIGVVLYIVLKNIGFGINTTGALLPAFLASSIIYYTLAKSFSNYSVKAQDQKSA